MLVYETPKNIQSDSNPRNSAHRRVGVTETSFLINAIRPCDIQNMVKSAYMAALHNASFLYIFSTYLWDLSNYYPCIVNQLHLTVKIISKFHLSKNGNQNNSLHRI